MLGVMPQRRRAFCHPPFEWPSKEGRNAAIPLLVDEGIKGAWRLGLFRVSEKSECPASCWHGAHPTRAVQDPSAVVALGKQRLRSLERARDGEEDQELQQAEAHCAQQE